MADIVIDTPVEDIELGTVKKWFREFSSSKNDENKEARESRKYYHGNQPSDAVKKELARRKQPPIISNFIRQTIDGIVG